jgi:hypothetical protein
MRSRAAHGQRSTATQREATHARLCQLSAMSPLYQSCSPCADLSWLPGLDSVRIVSQPYNRRAPPSDVLSSFAAGPHPHRCRWEAGRELAQNRPTSEHRRGSPRDESNPHLFKPLLHIQAPGWLLPAVLPRAQVERKSQPRQIPRPRSARAPPPFQRPLPQTLHSLLPKTTKSVVRVVRCSKQSSIVPVCLTHLHCSLRRALVCSHHMPVRPPARSAFRLSSSSHVGSSFASTRVPFRVPDTTRAFLDSFSDSQTTVFPAFWARRAPTGSKECGSTRTSVRLSQLPCEV